MVTLTHVYFSLFHVSCVLLLVRRFNAQFCHHTVANRFSSSQHLGFKIRLAAIRGEQRPVQNTNQNPPIERPDSTQPKRTATALTVKGNLLESSLGQPADVLAMALVRHGQQLVLPLLPLHLLRVGLAGQSRLDAALETVPRGAACKVPHQYIAVEHSGGGGGGGGVEKGQARWGGGKNLFETNEVQRRNLDKNRETSLDCMVSTFSKNMDQPGMVGNPARGQLNREN